MRTPTRIVVLIGGEQAPHRYVARTLAQLDNVSIVIAKQPRRRLVKRVTRAAKRPLEPFRASSLSLPFE